MSLYALKPQFQDLLRPLACRLHALGMTANQVTIAACVGSVAIGGSVAAGAAKSELFLLLPVWFFLRMAFNAIDGLLARDFGQTSTLGAYLNELTDVVSDAALYVPFAFLAGAGIELIGLVIFLAALSEIAGLMGAATGGRRRNDGPMGKSDRALVFGAIGLMVGIGVAPGPWLSWTLALVACLSVVTIANRVRCGLADAAARPHP